MSLVSFLETYKTGITQAVTDAYPPLVTRAEPIPGLLRKPLGYQAEAITAVAMSLEEHRNTLFVGEMGTGKSFCSIASAYKAGMQRTLVMCPPHLVEKWAREVHETVPGARTRILESITQIEALRWDVSTGPLFAILSREKAKLSHAWRPAYVMRKKRLKDDLGHWSTFSYPSCPRCGEVLETPEGLLSHDDLAKKRRTCQWCGEQLWQADPKGLRRYALGHYIAEKLPGFFDLLVLDEMHELKGGGSAQGIAAGALAEAIPHTLALTGTLFGGYGASRSL
jgi:ribosomal protein S27AE